ncbi:unnamed protein product [marine sediment metagenome]|uniref:Uncharacterized protein n=1 Tax=marine sediment metagenome TaxID=412755 RepID=X1ADZ8_9ZZZZ
MLDEISQLKSSLAQAIKVIKAWHGPEAWHIYLISSPEMEGVRRSLKLLRPNTVNDLMHNVPRETSNQD